jgi:hypothetical protein
VSLANTMTATLRYLTPEEGGRRRPLLNGGTSQLRVGVIQTSCNVVALDANGDVLTDDFLTLGQEYMVLLVMFDPVHYQPEMDRLQEIELREGNRLVAHGARVPGDRMSPAPTAAVALLGRASLMRAPTDASDGL